MIARPGRIVFPVRPREIVAKVETLRRERWTEKRIALEMSLSPATVSRIPRRLGLNRMRALEPPSRCDVASATVPAT